jgi:microcystin-dependent protein
MTSPYIGEIRLFAGSFAPDGWLFCDGKILDIGEYSTLYTLLGTSYGGDGQTSFGLPDLRGRTPVSTNMAYPQGMAAGVEDVTLSTLQMAAHNHPLLGTGQPATSAVPTPGMTLADQVGGTEQSVYAYAASGTTANLTGRTLGVAGGSEPHENMQPSLAVNYIIATQGEYPTPADD